MTPRVQGEPIVLGSDFGLLPSQEGKDFISGFLSHATGVTYKNMFNKSIEMDLCVNSDLSKSNTDIKVVTKMLDTYDSMSTKSQSAEALVTNYGTVVREGHKAPQGTLTPSQTESHTSSAPPWVLQSTEGGAEWDSVSVSFAQYLSTKEQQEVGLLILYGEQMEATGSFHNGSEHHFGRTPDSFSGWNNPSLYGPSLLTV